MMSVFTVWSSRVSVPMTLSPLGREAAHLLSAHQEVLIGVEIRDSDHDGRKH